MIGFMVNRAVRFVLEEVLEVDHEAAKWIGRAAGLAAGVAFADPSGALDVPDFDPSDETE